MQFGREMDDVDDGMPALTNSELGSLDGGDDTISEPPALEEHTDAESDEFESPRGGHVHHDSTSSSARRNPLAASSQPRQQQRWQAAGSSLAAAGFNPNSRIWQTLDDDDDDPHAHALGPAPEDDAHDSHGFPLPSLQMMPVAMGQGGQLLLSVPLPAGLSSLPGFAGSRQIVLSSSSSHSSGPEPLFVPGGGVTSPNMQFRGILPMMNRAEHSASQQQSSNRSRRQQQQQQQRPPTQQHQTAHEPPAGQPTARLDGLQELLNSLGPVQHPGTGSHGTGATASGRSSNTPGSRFVSGDSSSSSVRGARHTAGTTTAAGDPVNNRTAPTSSRGNSSSHGSSSAVDVPAAAGAGNGNSPAEGRSYSILRLPASVESARPVLHARRTRTRNTSSAPNATTEGGRFIFSARPAGGTSADGSTAPQQQQEPQQQEPHQVSSTEATMTSISSNSSSSSSSTSTTRRRVSFRWWPPWDLLCSSLRLLQRLLLGVSTSTTTSSSSSSHSSAQNATASSTNGPTDTRSTAQEMPGVTVAGSASGFPTSFNLFGEQGEQPAAAPQHNTVTGGRAPDFFSSARRRAHQQRLRQHQRRNQQWHGAGTDTALEGAIGDVYEPGSDIDEQTGSSRWSWPAPPAAGPAAAAAAEAGQGETGAGAGAGPALSRPPKRSRSHDVESGVEEAGTGAGTSAAAAAGTAAAAAALTAAAAAGTAANAGNASELPELLDVDLPPAEEGLSLEASSSAGVSSRASLGPPPLPGTSERRSSALQDDHTPPRVHPNPEPLSDDIPPGLLDASDEAEPEEALVLPAAAPPAGPAAAQTAGAAAAFLQPTANAALSDLDVDGLSEPPSDEEMPDLEALSDADDHGSTTSSSGSSTEDGGAADTDEPPPMLDDPESYEQSESDSMPEMVVDSNTGSGSSSDGGPPALAMDSGSDPANSDDEDSNSDHGSMPELECNTDDESGSDDDGLRRPAVSSSEAGRPGQQQGSRPGRGFLGQPLQRSSWSTAQQQLGSNTHDGDDEEEEDGEDHDYSYEDEEESEGSWETASGLGADADGEEEEEEDEDEEIECPCPTCRRRRAQQSVRAHGFAEALFDAIVHGQDAEPDSRQQGSRAAAAGPYSRPRSNAFVVPGTSNGSSRAATATEAARGQTAASVKEGSSNGQLAAERTVKGLPSLQRPRAGRTSAASPSSSSRATPALPPGLLEAAEARAQVQQVGDALADAGFTQQLLAGLPGGVDPGHPAVQQALDLLRGKQYVHVMAAAVTHNVPGCPSSSMTSHEELLFTQNARRASNMIRRWRS